MLAVIDWSDAMTFRWSTFLALVTTLKIMIAGVGVGLAALGALDVAFAVAAHQWWTDVRPDWLLSMFAATGAIGGVVMKVITT